MLDSHVREDNARNWRHKKWFKNLAKIFCSLIVLVAVFWLGLGIGSGSIQISRDRLSLDKTSSLPDNLDYQSVEEVYDSLKANFDGELTTDQLLDGTKQGLAKASGDPFTEYLNKEAQKEFEEQLNGTFEGIGAELTKEGANVIIVAPLDDFPAQKAGLKPRDIIAEINGESAYDITVSEAVSRIRGPKGTVVKLTIVRGNAVIPVEITRAAIVIPSVKSEILEGSIGYLRISRFGDDTVDLTASAAADFKKAGVKGVIVDLRGNPGGLLDASVGVSGLWLAKNKTVLEEKTGKITIKTFKAPGNNLLEGVPTVVLIDGGSASASEITAGALKDNGAATIIGVKSFGKGSVQSLIRLKGGGVLKVTIARWYTPNGRNIDKEGIEPDQKVELTQADTDANRDPQKDAALQKLKK